MYDIFFGSVEKKTQKNIVTTRGWGSFLLKGERKKWAGFSHI